MCVAEAIAEEDPILDGKRSQIAGAYTQDRKAWRAWRDFIDFEFLPRATYLEQRLLRGEKERLERSSPVDDPKDFAGSTGDEAVASRLLGVAQSDGQVSGPAYLIETETAVAS